MTKYETVRHLIGSTNVLLSAPGCGKMRTLSQLVWYLDPHDALAPVGYTLPALSGQIGQSPRTVRRHLTELEIVGMLRLSRRQSGHAFALTGASFALLDWSQPATPLDGSNLDTIFELLQTTQAGSRTITARQALSLQTQV